MNAIGLWERYKRYLCINEEIDLTLDISRMHFDDDYFESMNEAVQRAYEAMAELEKGAIANPDEQRMVGHYWLRSPQLAPTEEIADEITSNVADIKAFAADVHTGKTKPPQAKKFTQLLLIGIGGSALGPMFVADALGNPATDKMTLHMIDNTDPDGIARVLGSLADVLSETLCIVISKSGSTPEPRNGMLIVMDAFKKAGLDYARQAVAVTGVGSQLDRQAVSQGWIKRFKMWDWVGGRTSETSVVGLLPAALQGFDIDALLAGAADCDKITRNHNTMKNPAALLALMWYRVTEGRGTKAMIVLPYKDRLLLLSRYLQQLIMESLGKRLNLANQRVDQGITVYGNKGTTDQHAYVQQLRDGVNNFFMTFIRVLESGGSQLEVEPGITAGDYLHGFLMGTREALYANERESMTLTIRRVDARSAGVLIALFERAVGFYATLIGINAYHQPGVEAGKKAAAAILTLQDKAVAALSSTPTSAEQIAISIGEPDRVETVYAVIEYLAANGRAKMSADLGPNATMFSKTTNT